MYKATSNVYVNLWTREQATLRGCNSSFVVTSGGVVVIDTPQMPTDAIKWRDEIAKKGEARYIINTEHHPDHITGNFFIPGTVVSSQIVKSMFSSMLKIPGIQAMVKDKDPEGILLMEGYQPRPPTITFSDRLTLYLGEHSFELIRMPGHTEGQVGVFVPQEKVMFTGDNFANGWQPSMNFSCPLEWIESLKKIEAMEVEVVVPGHGKIGDKKSVRIFREFIQECVDTVRQAISQGMSQEEAAARITFEIEKYPPALHSGPQWQRRNVLRLYEMLSK
ncbi:MAG: MBL fold metallo-hydrolase [Dehalococcoidia bacterium]|nr:MBL fold metallo-hydrolase [Dehalococcoidia bacterium]